MPGPVTGAILKWAPPPGVDPPICEYPRATRHGKIFKS